MKITSYQKDLANAIPCLRPRNHKLLHRPRHKRSRRQKQALRFSPTAWAKLLFLRDYGETEVGGFGISAADDLLLIQDVRLVKQQCTVASVAFKDAAVADFFDEQVDAGMRPEQCGRIWIHTHPGDSPLPSGTDEETFARVFGRADWSLMFIVARGGATYARLQFGAGPGGSLLLPVRIAWELEFTAAHHSAWASEYAACVHKQLMRPALKRLLGREELLQEEIVDGQV